VSDEEEAATERVTQLWPASLKAQVQAIVGPRGITKFTLEAVRAKLGAPSDVQVQTERTVAEALGEPVAAVAAPPRPPEPAPVAVVEREAPAAPAPGVHESKLLEGEARGATIDVVTTSTGAAQEYSSSQARVQAMLEKAAQMGVKKAVELPVPPKPVLAEIAQPDQVADAPADEPPFDPEAYDAPTPDDQLTLQEELSQLNATKMEATAPASALEESPRAPAEIQTPVRNLDEIEIDF